MNLSDFPNLALICRTQSLWVGSRKSIRQVPHCQTGTLKAFNIHLCLQLATILGKIEVFTVVATVVAWLGSVVMGFLHPYFGVEIDRSACEVLDVLDDRICCACG